MTNKRKSFLLHIDSLDILDDLTNDQSGMLFKAIKAYQKGDEIDLDGITKVAFSPFKNQFIRDDEKYKLTCERRAVAGSIGGNRKQANIANASNSNKKLAKVADSVSDSKSDNDNEVIQQSFDHWWGLYPTTRRKNKKGCFTKWKSKCKKLSGEQIIELTNIVATDVEKRILDVSDVQFMPATESYLNQERWRDGE